VLRKVLITGLGYIHNIRTIREFSFANIYVNQETNREQESGRVVKKKKATIKKARHRKYLNDQGNGMCQEEINERLLASMYGSHDPWYARWQAPEPQNR